MGYFMAKEQTVTLECPACKEKHKVHIRSIMLLDATSEVNEIKNVYRCKKTGKDIYVTLKV
jgi:hypothetical protein